jgi:hypothetical protein
MSDYVHKKVVRLPFPKEILEKCDADNPWDCEVYLKEKLGDLWDNRNKNSFELEMTDKSEYIDWVYYHTYGEESGDWGNVRLLSEKELEVIKPYFDKLEVSYKDSDLRVVDYCYYNCSECSDYYDINVDDSNLFITKDVS